MIKYILSAVSIISINAFAKPLIVAHRGASGYRPEHTIAAYQLAIEQGADYIEPDLVATKDGVLIARHENEISETSDVATKFPKRKTKKTIDGKVIEGWFTEDFTLAEIKTLRAKERLAFRDQSFNSKYEIPTFDEILKFLSEQEKKTKRTIGVFPELKHPTYFRSIQLPLEPLLINSLRIAKKTDANSAVIIQCFEIDTLRELKKSLPKNKMVFLLAEMKLTEKDLKDLSTYAYGVGPDKSLLINKDGKDNGQVALFHKHNLKVIPYTFRKETNFISTFAKGDFQKELQFFLKLGVDGLFSDFPDLALQARDK
ncbi:MAG: glycerophosphodiester phosphodiesterase family protein [Bdellovibrionota bacterium]